MFTASSEQYEQTQTYSTSCSVNNMHTTKTHYVSNTKVIVHTHTHTHTHTQSSEEQHNKHSVQTA